MVILRILSRCLYIRSETLVEIRLPRESIKIGFRFIPFQVNCMQHCRFKRGDNNRFTIITNDVNDPIPNKISLCFQIDFGKKACDAIRSQSNSIRSHEPCPSIPSIPIICELEWKTSMLLLPKNNVLLSNFQSKQTKPTSNEFAIDSDFNRFGPNI
ncbi:hypothetical protein BLOT_014522 [Blomia tropicalis]|nr:hypothetical protein BLOT_014522 [Blomia tropicalis]